MAYVAACTDVGARKKTNEDSSCIQVARTPLGEVLMAIVCDGVGGLSRGNVASSTVIHRFVQWFVEELPVLMEPMVAAGSFDFDIVKAVWGASLQALNELIRAHGASVGATMGTTFTGIICCGGRYLVGHVGDCRAYKMSPYTFEQVTEDQTLVARKLAAGEITQQEARNMPNNVILQSVGTERVLAPAFYEGRLGASELVVICCDGAYKRPGSDGIRQIFQGLDYRNEAMLYEACRTLLRLDLEHGEKDNLTAICFSGALEGVAGFEAPAPVVAAPVQAEGIAWDDSSIDAVTAVFGADEEPEDDLPTMVDGAGAGEDDLPTMVDGAGAISEEDDLPTMVDGADMGDEDDLPTMVDGADAGEDDLPTMVDGAGMGDEDDLPTMVDGAGADSFEDDLPTMVDGAGAISDEDDLPTMVDGADMGGEDDLPTMVDSTSMTEDDLPTMVDGLGQDPDEDDLPTMVEGSDA